MKCLFRIQANLCSCYQFVCSLSGFLLTECLVGAVDKEEEWNRTTHCSALMSYNNASFSLKYLAINSTENINSTEKIAPFALQRLLQAK